MHHECVPEHFLVGIRQECQRAVRVVAEEEADSHIKSFVVLFNRHVPMTTYPLVSVEVQKPLAGGFRVYLCMLQCGHWNLFTSQVKQAQTAMAYGCW